MEIFNVDDTFPHPPWTTGLRDTIVRRAAPCCPRRSPAHAIGKVRFPLENPDAGTMGSGWFEVLETPTL
ncbi:hypothetical protein KKI24_28155 [bacterium]|nr:hypothetical protein [bacterium]